MKKIVLLCILLFSIIAAFCQTVDTVILKDGTTLTGTIRQYEPGKFVIINLEDGTEKALNWDVISSVDKQSDNEQSEIITKPVEPQPKPGKVKIKAKNIIQLQYDQTLPSDKLREYWQKQGGSRFYNDYYTNVISLRMQMADTSGVKLDGIGFGLGGSMNWLYFNPPEYSTRKFYSFATKIGFCYDANLNGFSMKNRQQWPDPMGGDDYYIETNTDILTSNVDLGLNLGVNMGAGTFVLSQKWYGVIMGLTWRPVYRISSTNTTVATNSNVPFAFGRSTTNSSDSQFDKGSIEYSLDIGSIKALSDKFAPRSALKLNFIYVPPIGKNKISMMMFGIGVSQYR